MAFSQSFRKGQVHVNCKLCDTDRQIQWKCMQCTILMCSYCKDKVHSQFKNAQDHKIIKREEIGLHSEELDFTNIKCHKHNSQSSCLYCNTCEILVCPTCVAKVHKRHDLIEIRDKYKMKIERLKEGQRKMQRSNSYMNSKKKEINKLLSAENSKYSKVRQDILAHEKNVKEQVEKYFKELVNKLDQSHKTILTLVKSDLNALSLFTNQTEDKINEVQEFIDICNGSEFFKKVTKMENCTEIQEPQTKPSYSSSPKFIPGNVTQCHVGLLQDDGLLSADTNISIVINNEYQSELCSISFFSPCIDQKLWLYSHSSGLLQRAKPEGTNLKVMSKFNILACGMAVTLSNQLLLCVLGKTRLQQISSTGDLTDSVYDVKPYLPTAIHIISDNKLIVASVSGKLKRGAVIIMNKQGDKETMYEHHEYNQSIFNNPRHITCTCNGNLHVVDTTSDGRIVVVLGQQGHIINQYTGHLTINMNKPFIPVAIVTTPSDNVVVMDQDTYILHILNDNGHLVSFFNTTEIGIRFPYSLAFNTAGHLYIGCIRASGSKTIEAKLYEVNIEGF